MSNNNPFRKNPSDPSIQQKTEQWGQVKFKPSYNGDGGGKFQRDSGRGGGGGRGGFGGRGRGGGGRGRGGFGGDRGRGGFGRGRGGRGGFGRGRGGRGGSRDFHNRDDDKFNVVDKNARPENSTPWNKFKNDINYKQQEEEQNSKQANFDTEEGKQVTKQREQNYRKALMEQKRNEPTQWDDFGQNDATDNNNDDKNINKKPKKNKNKKQKKEETPSILPESKPEFKAKSQTKKKKIKDRRNKTEKKEIVSKDLLENFDAKKLTFQQNDTLRKMITKATLAVKGSTLNQNVKDLKSKINKTKKKTK